MMDSLGKQLSVKVKRMKFTEVEIQGIIKRSHKSHEIWHDKISNVLTKSNTGQSNISQNITFLVFFGFCFLWGWRYAQTCSHSARWIWEVSISENSKSGCSSKPFYQETQKISVQATLLLGNSKSGCSSRPFIGKLKKFLFKPPFSILEQPIDVLCTIFS